MKKSEEQKKPAAAEVTTEQINALVEETKVFLEKLMGKKLFAEIFHKESKEPFWRISKEKNAHGIICTIYFPTENKLGFWCTHENCTPGKYSEYDELKQKVEELAKKLGLGLKDLNIRKRIR